MRLLAKRFISAANISFQKMNMRRYCGNKCKDELTLEKIKQNIEVERYTGVMMININRQPTRNSLDLATLKEITDAVNFFEKDPNSLVLVINGEGGNFCSGFDIDEMDEKGYNTFVDASISGTVNNPISMYARVQKYWISILIGTKTLCYQRFKRRPFTEKPCIAAVSGYAVAEGLELALCCDLRVVEDTAQLGCLGRRFGIPQSFVGHERLVALIGQSRALDLLITGRLIDGKEAHRNGLACKVTATGTALGEAMKLAKSLLKFPQAALIIDKMAAVHSVLNPASEDSLRDETIMQSHLGAAVEDLKVGVKKFLSGTGRQGKFYQLSEIGDIKEWEMEDAVEEIYVIQKRKQKKNKNKQIEKKDSKDDKC